MDVEVVHVILGGIPPFVRVTRYVVRIVYYRHLAELRAQGTIKIEDVQPCPRPVQHLTCVELVTGLRGIRMVKVHVHRYADRLAEVNPRTVFLPPTGGDWK